MMEQRTDEWFQARLGKVTASRICDVLAATSTAGYQNYQAQLIAERLTGEPYEGHVTTAMQWGIEKEAEARSLYEFMTDNTVMDIGFAQHETMRDSGASPDGLVDGDGQIEIKCPNTATHIRTLTTRKIDKKYRNQMTWQMACTGRKWCDFISYDPRLPAEHNLCVIRFERDNEEVKEMELAVRQFLCSLNDKISQMNAIKEKTIGR